MILIKLFAHATQAILDVAANHSRWLITPLQASVCFDRMVTHHGQLRGFYGIMHLAAKISSHTPDTMATLFVDINDKTEPDMQPSKWRTAIKLDDFYGRHFGFHYTPEMRNVLRVVNIARGSVLKSHNEDDTSPQLIKNAVMLGWGWIYSNMVIMDNLGLTIDGVSRIGADVNPDSLTIEQLRKFMNLVEEPLVAGVSGLASVDVAIDTSFEIPPPGHEGGLEMANDTATDALHEVLEAITDTVRLRLISQKNRPIDLVKLRSKPATNNTIAKKQPVANSTKPSTDEGQNNVGRNDTVESVHNNEYNHSTAIVSDINVLDEAVVLSADDTAQYTTTTPPLTTTTYTGCILPSATSYTNANSSNGTPSTSLPPSTSTSPSVASTAVVQKVEPRVDIDGLNNSFLASTIKSEFRKFQSNVSTFLGLEVKRPASGLILYFHGGGFVSQSSESHAPYLKEWCCDVPDSVLLSVDYRLAPEFKFPRAMYECLYAYIWALQNASALGTSADRVVFTGDSAGGNLAIATALKASELGIRGADGICVSYPALYLTAAWSPSRLLSFFDPMLPVSVLELCLKSYIPDDVNPKTHPLVSPLAASDEALQRLGPITVVSGSLDPLLDDAAVFAQRLRNLRSDDTFHVFQSMPHGFLNMCHVNETARTGMRFLARMIAQYLELPLRKRSKEEVATTELAVSQADATESAQKFTTS